MHLLRCEYFLDCNMCHSTNGTEPWLLCLRQSR